MHVAEALRFEDQGSSRIGNELDVLPSFMPRLLQRSSVRHEVATIAAGLCQRAFAQSRLPERRHACMQAGAGALLQQVPVLRLQRLPQQHRHRVRPDWAADVPPLYRRSVTLRLEWCPQTDMFLNTEVNWAYGL
jgi:hypothetical protein